MSWSRARQTTRLVSLLLLLLLLLPAACTHAAGASGRAPENLTRDPPHGDPAAAAWAAAARRQAAYEERKSKAPDADVKVEKVDVSATRVGVVGTHEFHRSDCPLLKGVTAAEEIRFVSPWDALDAGYRPCESCRAAR